MCWMACTAAALWTLAAWGNGPAWLAELSDTNPRRATRLEVVIPVGSHVAVGVYNTDAVEAKCPPGVTATVRTLWFEQRTVYTGTPQQREAAIPYYLPKPGDCTPTGSWVVELQPTAAGTYTVPLACNTNTLTVRLRVVNVPASLIGYGFYTDPVRMADPSKELAYYRDMAAHGMNTLTPYAREYGPRPWDYAQCLAAHINLACEAGLVDQRFPLLCLSAEPESITRAPQFAKYDWPELVGYNCDEPGADKGPEVAACAARYKAAGLRNGTAIDGAIAQKIGDPLDIWVLHMDSMTGKAIAAAQTRGKERWMYNCALRGTNAAQHRYWTGVYTWAMAPVVCLTWTYMHSATSRITPAGAWAMERVYDTASADRNGDPIPTVALEGLQEGIIDSRLLQLLARRNTPEGNQYLRDLRASVDMRFWTNGVNREGAAYVWDVPDTQVPPVDCIAVRRDVVRLLGL